jgi:hypothetical protein
MVKMIPVHMAATGTGIGLLPSLVLIPAKHTSFLSVPGIPCVPITAVTVAGYARSDHSETIFVQSNGAALAASFLFSEIPFHSLLIMNKRKRTPLKESV